MSISWFPADGPIRSLVSGAMQQHPAYAAACSGLGCETLWLHARDDGNFVGQALAIKRRIAGLLPMAMVARGPTWVSDCSLNTKRDALEALPRALDGRRGMTLVSPDGSDSVAAAPSKRPVVRTRPPAEPAITSAKL